jgi:hypothetical protein
MSIAKVIEVIAESSQSFDHAVSQGVTDASKTVKNIKGIWVKEMTGVVEGDKVTTYRVAMKVTFLVDR